MEILLALAALIVAALAWHRSGQALTEAAQLRAALAFARTLPGDPAMPAAPFTAPPGPTEAGPSIPPQAPAPPPLPAPPPFAPPPVAPPFAPPPLQAPAQRIDLEQLLTQQWGVWLGAFAILLAGVFLVRYAVEHAVFGPAARCAIGAALGLVLIGLAGWLRRRPESAPARLPMVDYVPAALAAGGLAMLFAASYGAGPLYGIVPEPIGFALLAAVAVAALALSLLFGRLVAALGLLGAFATPALVQTTDPSLPGLFAYLLLVSAASWAVVRTTAWTWLGWGAAAGGAAWVMLATVGMPLAQTWAPGLFVPAAAALTLAFLPDAALDHPAGRRFAWAPMLMLGLAGLLLAAATRDPVVRAGLFLLAPVAMAKAWTQPRLAYLPMVSAGLAILALLIWAVPNVLPTAEAITVEGTVQAVLPGPFAPDAIIPFLQAALLVAAFHALAGLVGERRTPNPLPWAALTAGVPVLVLATAYLQVGRFQTQTAWAVGALLLTAALVGTAGLARREGSIQRAGVHAAGAVAALAMGASILLDTAWLTVALALILPALAWIAEAAGLPPLRRVAFVVAGVVVVRLVLNPWLPTYALGATPVFNLLLAAYGIPAACFALAARMFARGGRGRLVPLLQAGAALFTFLLLALQVRHAVHRGDMLADDPSFTEAAWLASILGAYAVVLFELSRRLPGRVLDAAWRVVGAIALAIGAGLLLLNPLVVGLASRRIIGNAMLPAYLVPGALAVLALIRGARPRPLLGGYALLALLVWVTATVRQAFHPGRTALWQGGIEEAELWAVSAAWLGLAAAVLATGIASGARPVRLAGLALVALVVAKVFLWDMADLEGLWRALSFLGLGLGLIGLGAAYRRFAGHVAPPAPPLPPPLPLPPG